MLLYVNYQLVFVWVNRTIMSRTFSKRNNVGFLQVTTVGVRRLQKSLSFSISTAKTKYM